jgi:hypothetical protein
MRKHRAHPILLLGLATSLLVPFLTVGPAQAVDTASVASVTSRDALFGGTTPLVPVQPKIGHLGIVRMYYNLGEQFRGSALDAILHSGSTALVSLDDPPKNGPSYASIIAGRYDSEIRSFLTQVEHAAVQYHLSSIYFAFEHEANAPSHLRLGTPAQFAEAYNHIHALAAGAKLNWNDGGRIRWALILEHMAYFTKAERPPWSLGMGFASDYWPGSDVNVVASDGYNQADCASSKSANFKQPGDSMVTPASMFDPVLAFAKAHGNLPVFIAEWASVAYINPTVRPQFIREMQAYVLANPQIKAAMYWDSSGGGNHGNGGPGSASCNFSVNGDVLSMAALAAMNRALGAATVHFSMPGSKGTSGTSSVSSHPNQRQPHLVVTPAMEITDAGIAVTRLLGA